MNEFAKKKARAVAPVFHAAGAALFECQHFEFTIANYLLCLSRLGHPKVKIQEIQDILSNKKKLTAGQLVQRLKEHVEMRGHVPKIFAEALEARNQIVHKQLIENIERFSSIAGRAEVIHELKVLTSKVNRANESLAPFIKHVSAELDGTRYQEMLAEFEKTFE